MIWGIYKKEDYDFKLLKVSTLGDGGMMVDYIKERGLNKDRYYGDLPVFIENLSGTGYFTENNFERVEDLPYICLLVEVVPDCLSQRGG